LIFRALDVTAEQAAERVPFVIPSEARDLLFFPASKIQQIPRANPALRNDMMRVFPQPLKPRPTKIICEIASGQINSEIV
jgi:hypothetical protein